jgi:DtxR family Mn-dependent transcriptional regulator
VHKAEEDYIKMIHELQSESGDVWVKPSVLAQQFDYTVQSVNGMLKRLETRGYLSYTPYKGAQLSALGKAEAVRLIRAHRIWEAFLGEKLHLSWEELHPEAERLEHTSSDKVIDALYDFLGQPLYCRHGNPIPDKEGRLPKTYRKPLSEAVPGTAFKVYRVHDYEPLLIHLNEANIRLYDVLKVLSVDAFTGSVIVEFKGQAKTLTRQVAQMIFGEAVQ